MTTPTMSRLERTLTHWPTMPWPMGQCPFQPAHRRRGHRCGHDLGLVQVRCEENSLGFAGQVMFAFHTVNTGVGRWPDAAVSESSCLDKLIQLGARDFARRGSETPDAEQYQGGRNQSGPGHEFVCFQKFHACEASVTSWLATTSNTIVVMTCRPLLLTISHAGFNSKWKRD